MSIPWSDVGEFSFLGLNFVWCLSVFIKALEPRLVSSGETADIGAAPKLDSKRVSCDQVLKLMEIIHSVLKKVVNMDQESVPKLLDCLMRDTRRSFCDRQIYVPNEILAPMTDLLSSAARAVGQFESDRKEYGESLVKIRSDYALLVSRIREAYCI